jgi:hypothetical protein
LGPGGVVFAGPQFVFVDTAHFDRAIRPSNVIVNKTVVINKTRVVNNIKQETRIVGGGRRTVMVNEGPGLAAVQKASGRAVSTVPIQEAARRARVPTLSHGATFEPGEKAARDLRTKESPPTVNAPKPPESVLQVPQRPGANREPTARWRIPVPVNPRQPSANPPHTTPQPPMPGKPPATVPQSPNPKGPPAEPGQQHEPEHRDKEKP